MYIPSSFLHKVICSEQIGVFCESNSDGYKAVIAKIPTSTIKSIALGAKVEFYLYTMLKSPYYLALGMKIIDNISSPLYAIIPQRWQNSNNIFNSYFLDCELDFVVYDETDAPIQQNKMIIKTNFKNKRVHDVLKNTTFNFPNDSESANYFIDTICADLGFNFKPHPDFPIVGFKFPVKITKVNTIFTIHANDQGTTQYDVVKDIDGTRQERQIFQAFCLMDNSETTLSPLVKIGLKERELTDILTVTQNKKLIVVESKCLQYDISAFDKTASRTASNIIGHCKKAISQLEGAHKTIKRGERIYNSDGKTLLDGGDYSFYGIVIIDEFRPSKDWDAIISLMKICCVKHDICINVISISELIYTMKLCISSTDLLIQSLEDRYKACICSNNVNVQLRNSSLPTMI
ncbi:hypothetical protein JY436_02600 [Serratia marcescens]|uniref:hypothetical protein n=1 Tax=Enterobacterales TaxID=91347 RepID=UPI00193AD815|nr:MULTISPECIES: hypothetical protein [Enterobacterales]MBM1117598.1 hypothetical protein [Klebsiella grimontii]MBN5237931.1 hypothetical protein [Serratia marcescens]